LKFSTEVGLYRKLRIGKDTILKTPKWCTWTVHVWNVWL